MLSAPIGVGIFLPAQETLRPSNHQLPKSRSQIEVVGLLTFARVGPGGLKSPREGCQYRDGSVSRWLIHVKARSGA
jgi:hypothetical protein